MQHFTVGDQAMVEQYSLKMASNPTISSGSTFSRGIEQMTDTWNHFYACRRKGVPGGALKPQQPCSISLHRWQSTDVTCPVVIVHILGGMQNTITDQAIWKSCSGKVILKRLQNHKRTKSV